MPNVFRKIFLRLVFISTLANLQISTFAQDSSHIRISLLTCTPGEELYATFGHSALRITDSSSVTDIVFNYGTFNFDDEGFYIKFIRGKLLYYVSTENFEDFKSTYQTTNRGITEQVLNLSAEEKIDIENALYANSKEENKYYKYDFFFDNCTTRLRDIVVKYKRKHIAFKAVMPARTTFRQAIHEYLDKNEKKWSELGIDIALGAPTDAVMTVMQSQFLPDNLMKAFDSSNQDHQLVVTTTNLYSVAGDKSKRSFFTPIAVFSLLLLTIIVLNFSAGKRAKMFVQGFDGAFFFLTGTLGIFLIFMWTGTDHTMCKNNFNLLWAWPTHAVIAFFVNSKKKWVKIYFGFTAAALLIVLLSWFFLPQQMNNGLLRIVVLLIYRSYQKCLAATNTL